MHTRTFDSGEAATRLRRFFTGHSGAIPSCARTSTLVSERSHLGIVGTLLGVGRTIVRDDTRKSLELVVFRRDHGDLWDLGGGARRLYHKSNQRFTGTRTMKAWLGIGSRPFRDGAFAGATCTHTR